MKNFISKSESALFFESGYSCDNAIFLNLNGEKFFLTDGRYAFEARESVKGDVEVICASELAKSAGELVKKCGVKELIFDPCEFSVFAFDELKKWDVSLLPEANFSHKKRMVKSPSEVAKLRRAHELGRAKFSAFASALKAGLSERELNFTAEEILRERGAFELSFAPITALNANAAKAHALPSNANLREGDLLLFDAGIKFEGYCSDRTRTAQFFEGFVFDKAGRFDDAFRAEIYAVVAEAQKAAFSKVKPGALACEVDAAAREVVVRAGFGEAFFHSTGHGVGLDIHELPRISATSQTVLEKGMVFSVEPGIYLEGKFGVRVEDVVVVTEDGFEILGE